MSFGISARLTCDSVCYLFSLRCDEMLFFPPEPLEVFSVSPAQFVPSLDSDKIQKTVASLCIYIK